jgi:hypothetical protein
MRDGPGRERVLWPRVAGVALLVDGALGLVAAFGFVALTMFPPVAAIEGRPPVEQAWLVEAAIALSFAIAALWSGQRAVRAIRRGRLVGVAVAGALVVTISVAFMTTTFTIGDAAMSLGILGVHLVAGVALLAWPSTRP